MPPYPEFSFETGIGRIGVPEIKFRLGTREEGTFFFGWACFLANDFEVARPGPPLVSSTDRISMIGRRAQASAEPRRPVSDRKRAFQVRRGRHSISGRACFDVQTTLLCRYCLYLPVFAYLFALSIPSVLINLVRGQCKTAPIAGSFYRERKKSVIT